MCGIAGLWSLVDADKDFVTENILGDMADHLVHRGPDASGIWVSDDQSCGLAHRRLSILDLSPAGAQPMTSDNGRFVIVFNGEIYNHLSLRADLETARAGVAWRGHSDTETLLAGVAQWGLEDTLKRCCGMFALALWDSEARVLSLARDRMGEKPLYLAKLAQGWAFASEPQAFQALTGFSQDLCQDALASFMTTGAMPDDTCVFVSVRKIRPGGILHLSADAPYPVETVYDDFPAVMARGLAMRESRTNDSRLSSARRIEAVLQEVIRSQMLSDVPLGSFLSGGVDSSLITALMQEVSSQPVKTFSIGFDDLGYDESHHAEDVAAHLGTDHTTYRLSEQDALDLVPRLASIYAEPFADSSQIPTALLSQFARQKVTVALTGDGGDEVFGGYNRYVLAPRLWARLSRMPKALRRQAGTAAALVSWMGGANSGVLRQLIARLGLPASTLNKAARLGEIAAQAGSLQEVYHALTRHHDDPALLLASATPMPPKTPISGYNGLSAEDWMMAMDSVSYLPSDILTKVDRAAMSASLETRVPYLDARTVEAAWSLPREHKIRNGVGKCVLRDILYRHVPREMIERPKQGFAVPIDRWLRGPLRGWADDLLAPDRLVDSALNAEEIRRLWALHLSGRANHGACLWSALMLQSCLAEWKHAGIVWPNEQPPVTARSAGQG